MTEMKVNRGQMWPIHTGWVQADSVLTAMSNKAADTSGEWAPAVQAAVTGYASTWKSQLSQLASEAGVTAGNISAFLNNTKQSDEDSAAAMANIQKATAR